MHVLPRVRELHERFPDLLSVIGVHAGKFPTERHTDRIAEACDRLGVHHAVVNDRQFRTWKEYGARAWPTVALIDPEGRLIGVQAGEFDVDALAATIQRIAEKAASDGTLVRGPDPAPGRTPHHEGPLRFPTRMLVAADRLWISDTGHGRVLECEWHPDRARAEVLAEHTGLMEPRGVVMFDGRLHVADRAAHTIWRFDHAGERTRVAGTGVIARNWMSPGPAEQTELRSPWGLVARGRDLFVAMAGSHQVWRIAQGLAEPWAGAGGEDIVDGPRLDALLAQPTGLALGGDTIFSADCEASGVRALHDDVVGTVVGTDLFDFGDKDGSADEARLQHCEDVEVFDGVLAVVDTYNDRLKRVDPATRECLAWPGEAGEAGAFREPAGVSSGPHAAAAGSAMRAGAHAADAEPDFVLVADTGNHRVVMVDGTGRMTEVELV